MKRRLALLLLFIGSLFVLPANAQQIEEPDTTALNVEIPPMKMEVNPVMEILDTFLPDTIGAYKSITDIRNDITSELTGCFKTYQKLNNPSHIISINIRRGELSQQISDNNDGKNTEESFVVNGLKSKLIKMFDGKLSIIEIEINGKVVSFSYRGYESENTLNDFTKNLNYNILSNL